jgi:hypothetical protein
MAGDGDPILIEQKISRLSLVSEEKGMKVEVENELTLEDKHCAQKWGFRVKDLYKLALRFYKGELEPIGSIFRCISALARFIRVCSSLFTSTGHRRLGLFRFCQMFYLRNLKG